MTLQNRINPQGLFNEKVCESALFHQKNESYPQRGAENAQKDAVASKVYLTFDATAPVKEFIFFSRATSFSLILPCSMLSNMTFRLLSYTFLPVHSTSS